MASANWNNSSSKSNQQPKSNNNRRKNNGNNNNNNNNQSGSGRANLNDKVQHVIDQYSKSNSYLTSSYNSELNSDMYFDSIVGSSFGSMSLNESRQTTANNSHFRNTNNNTNNTRNNANKSNSNIRNINASKPVYATAVEVDEMYTCGVCHTILDSPHTPDVCQHM